MDCSKKMVHVFPSEVLQKILKLGGNIGGGGNMIYQHINVDSKNKEQIIEILENEGFIVEPAVPC